MGMAARCICPLLVPAGVGFGMLVGRVGQQVFTSPWFHRPFLGWDLAELNWHFIFILNPSLRSLKTNECCQVGGVKQ